MQIRVATTQDSPALARIQVDSYRTAYQGILPDLYLAHFSVEEQTQDWRDLLASGTGDLLLVAETPDGQIAGYALGRPTPVSVGAPIPAGAPANPATYDAELVALHVRPAYQGQGAGRQLIAALALALQAAGCRSLLLWTLARNPARALYERLGGQLVGRQPWDGNQTYAVDVTEVAYAWPDIEHLAALPTHDP
jgi:ribosomal protein S18 acetylase RimI-like enzyme